MKLKNILIGLIISIASTCVFAGTQSVIINVTPQVLAAQAGMSMPWRVSLLEPVYGYDIENETSSDISLTLKINTKNFAEGISFGVSSSGEKGCGIMFLNPGQTITCIIEPQAHLEFSQMHDLRWDNKSPSPIEGTYILVKA